MTGTGGEACFAEPSVHRQATEPMRVHTAGAVLKARAACGVSPPSVKPFGMANLQHGGPGLAVPDVPAGAPPPPEEWANTTTVMMRNIPNKYTQRMLFSELNHTGFLGAFDFLYLPIDPETNANRGYSFINFSSPGLAWTFKVSYDGRKMYRFNSYKVVTVVPATLQGFEANYAHYVTARVNRGDPSARPLFLREPAQPISALPLGSGGSWQAGLQPRGRLSNLDHFAADPAATSGGSQPRTQQQRQQRQQQRRHQQQPQQPQRLQQQPPGQQLQPWPGWPPDIDGLMSAPSYCDNAAFGAAPFAALAADGSGSSLLDYGAQPLVPEFCPQCGGSIEERFQFCPQCGLPLDFLR